jgi:hypothetical protein
MAGVPDRMTIQRLAVYTTWYPGVEGFLQEWHRSLVRQTDQDFDVWIGVDALDPRERARALGGLQEAHWVFAAPGDTPARIRERAMTQLVEAYPAVVFVDSDDVLLPSRVAAARAALEAHDITACALRIVDEGGHDLGLVFGRPDEGDWGGFLPRHNVFGLSNSAYRSTVLRHLLPLPADCILIDWLLATRAWVSGRDLSFDPEPRMAYRQYGANVAKVVPPFTATDILRATEAVRSHYRLLLDDASWTIPSPSRSVLASARERFCAFESFVLASPENLARYVGALNRLAPRYVWWWAVANPELESLWKT